MRSQSIQKKGLLAKFLDNALMILLKKECRKIGSLKIDIIASSFEIIKGTIKKININATDINYKNLIFDNLEIEAKDVKMNFDLIRKKLSLENNLKVDLKLILSEDSLSYILLSNDWNWVGHIIRKEIFNQNQAGYIKIVKNKIKITDFRNNEIINDEELLDIKAEKGKVYIKNDFYNKSIEIPIEDKLYVKKIYIKDNSINILASSTITF